MTSPVRLRKRLDGQYVKGKTNDKKAESKSP